jgi:UDP-glucose 4-epimerase
MAQKISVTGGTGYIGSHTATELQKAGYEVIIIDNLSNSFAFIVDNIEKISGIRPEFHKIDLCDKVKVNDFFKSHRDIIAVIHFAAFKMVGESVANPNKYYYNNTVALLNLLEGMKHAKINKLVFSSSCTVYGQPENVPVTEDFPVVKAESPYGNTKQICEDIISDNCRVTDLNAISLRYFNPIGADSSGLIGELPIGKPCNLMPVITQVAIGKLNTCLVHGNDYPTKDGTAIRDYFHVSDLAEAHIAALDYLIKQKNINHYSIFNLGSDQGYSVLEVIKTFEKANGIRLLYEIGPRRPGDVTKIWADSSRAFRELGWKTKRSLEDMVVSSWKWEQYLASDEGTANIRKSLGSL